MSDRERLIELAKATIDGFKRLQASGPALRMAEQVIAELDPQPRELWGKRGAVEAAVSGGAKCYISSAPNGLHIYATTAADAVRRFNAAAEAIERSDKEAADGA